MKYKRIIYYNYNSNFWESYYINNKGKYVQDKIDFSLNSLKQDLKSDGYLYSTVSKKASIAHLDVDDIISAQRSIDYNLKKIKKLKPADKVALLEKSKIYAANYKVKEIEKITKKLSKKYSEKPLLNIKQSFALFTTSKSKFWLSKNDFKNVKNNYKAIGQPARIELKINIGDKEVIGIVSHNILDSQINFQNAVAGLIAEKGEKENLKNFDIDNRGNIKITLKGKI